MACKGSRVQIPPAPLNFVILVSLRSTIAPDSMSPRIMFQK